MVWKVLTPTCMVCGESGIVELSNDAYARYKGISPRESQTSGLNRADENGPRLIQARIPEISEDIREMLITGTHPACWELMEQDEDMEIEAAWDRLDAAS